jgi:hypothetical protein
MWQHITGVEQPAKKIKLDNNEKLERNWILELFQQCGIFCFSLY